MIPPEESATSVGERRRATRREGEVALRVLVETKEFSGQAENHSQAGVFFFSDEPLLVRVELEQNGETRTYSGRIVRVERFSQEKNGFAIEFDPA